MLQNFGASSEMRELGAFGRQRRSLRGPSPDQREIELVLPAGRESRALESASSQACALGCPFARSRRAPRSRGITPAFTSSVGQTEVLLRRDVAEHRRAMPSRSSRRGGHVVVSGAMSVVRASVARTVLVARSAAPCFADESSARGRAFVHHLDVIARRCASARLRLQLGELPRHSRRQWRPGQAVAGERHVIGAQSESRGSACRKRTWWCARHHFA